MRSPPLYNLNSSFFLYFVLVLSPFFSLSLFPPLSRGSPNESTDQEFPVYSFNNSIPLISGF